MRDGLLKVYLHVTIVTLDDPKLSEMGAKDLLFYLNLISIA